jgi:phage shock protein A
MSEASNGRTVDATRFYRLYDVLMETWAEVYAVQTAIEHRRKRNDEARDKLTPRAREALDAALGQLYVPQEVTNAELGGLDSVRNRIWAALRKEGASPQPSALAELTALAEEMDCEDGPAARRASAGIRAAVAKLRGLAGALAEVAP